jgi:hypothetical protein
MAEAIVTIGLVLSIMTFVEVNATVISRVREYHSITQEIPKAFQNIATQIPLLIDILSRIQNRSLNGSLTTDSETMINGSAGRDIQAAIPMKTKNRIGFAGWGILDNGFRTGKPNGGELLIFF